MNRKFSLPTFRNARIHFLFFTLCALCFLCGESPAQNFKTVHDGVEYAHVDHKIGNDPVKINLLRLDLKKVRLDVHHALDSAIGTEKTSSIATRYGAVAAINAGFFRLDTSIFAGDSAGILMIDGKLWSESTNNRTAIVITNGKNQTEVEFRQAKSNLIAGFGTDSEFAFDGINRERKPDEIILYTPEFHRTTLTDSSGTEIVFANCDLANFSKRCINAEIFESHGSSVIPPNGMVISIGKNAFEKSNNILYHVKPRNNREPKDVRIVFRAETPETSKQTNLLKAEDLTNGVPQLIKNGKIDISWEQEKSSKAFVETRHPRTAVAKLKNGEFLMITVDGRQSGVSVGMNLYELAEYLFSLGAVEAMNLDGGGSTTMFLDGKVVNKPSDKEGERKVSDAILVTLRKGKSKGN